MSAWIQIAQEAAHGFAEVVARAYSEFMPPPYVALKPYAPTLLGYPAIGERGFALSEYEDAEELAPGLEKLARHLLGELADLSAGRPSEFSQSMLQDNRAWPPALAAHAGRSAPGPVTVALPLALSRTQDDKGRVRWTLFGSSHTGPGRAFWRSFGPADEARFAATVAWMAGLEATTVAQLRDAGLRLLPRAPEPGLPAFDEGEPPAFVRPLLREGAEVPRVLLTFESFERLPPELREAHLAGALAVVPSPASQVFFEHKGYRALARTLPLALQLPLLSLYPRSESTFALRIPQSGWLDEKRSGAAREHGHRMARTVVRSHRWQRVSRDAELPADSFGDHATVALFSNDADELGLYHKPMGRNAQIWTESYQAVLHGPDADRARLLEAARLVRAGGRYGYRLVFPAMRAGARELFWHRPLLARLDPPADPARPAAEGRCSFPPTRLLGFVTAERKGAAPLELEPTLLDRDGHREAATAFPSDPGQPRRTTASNIRRILEFSELLERPLAPSLARSLLDVAKETSLDRWIDGLRARATSPTAAERTLAALQRAIGPVPAASAAPPSLTYEATRRREFEVALWEGIASLAHGEFVDKDNADGITKNEGRTGGEAGRSLARPAKPGGGRDLDALADHLLDLHRLKIERHGMAGRALVAEQRFRWDTDFDFPWSRGWAMSREKAAERNLVVVIPGRNPREAVLMADHYDTAYMEDVYDPSRGGDRLRAAAHGADDNHSATVALLQAADVLLPLAREGKLERSVWLVHLTGEEFPADCLGARALARALVRGDLALTRPGAPPLCLGGTRVLGAYVLDMIGHNKDRDLNVFQISPGEGAGSARLAEIAHLANERWNRSVPTWNKAPERKGRGRSQTAEGATPPPVAEHLALRGEVRTEWEPRSALYNTDGQIFSDLGLPVVLFMENYDLRRTGYHDTHDTMKNLDLDYCAALAAIAIESVADAACARSLG